MHNALSCLEPLLTHHPLIWERDWMDIKLDDQDLISCVRYIKVLSTHSMQQTGHRCWDGQAYRQTRDHPQKKDRSGLITESFNSGRGVTKDPRLCFNSTGQQATYSCNLSPGQHELGLRQHTLLDGGRETTRVLWLRLVEVKQKEGLSFPIGISCQNWSD